jgi:hypothetical protein
LRPWPRIASGAHFFFPLKSGAGLTVKAFASSFGVPPHRLQDFDNHLEDASNDFFNLRLFEQPEPKKRK